MVCEKLSPLAIYSGDESLSTDSSMLYFCIVQKKQNRFEVHPNYTLTRELTSLQSCSVPEEERRVHSRRGDILSYNWSSTQWYQLARVKPRKGKIKFSLIAMANLDSRKLLFTSCPPLNTAPGTTAKMMIRI